MPFLPKKKFDCNVILSENCKNIHVSFKAFSFLDTSHYLAVILTDFAFEFPGEKSMYCSKKTEACHLLCKRRQLIAAEFQFP